MRLLISVTLSNPLKFIFKFFFIITMIKNIKINTVEEYTSFSFIRDNKLQIFINIKQKNIFIKKIYNERSIKTISINQTDF